MDKAFLEGFNLVIERLLISGGCVFGGAVDLCSVSISLSSGFSFQDNSVFASCFSKSRFNLVIERLLISGE